MLADTRPIVVFDGTCVLCSRWVDFVLRHDRGERYRLAAMQGTTGQALLGAHWLSADDPTSFLLVQSGHGSTDTEAFTRALHSFGPVWRLVAASLRIVPRWLRPPISMDRATPLSNIWQARTELLDGLGAITHWRAAQQLAERFPEIRVDPNVLFVDNGRILTSAGASAGLDLCLHMIRLDHGNAVAAEAARCAVMPLGREGGKAQFIAYDPPESHSNLSPLLQWIEQRLDQALSLDDMARQAAMSSRTLNRRFQEQLSTSPLQWLLRARIRLVQSLLENTSLSVEQIVTAAGFCNPTSMREHFNGIVGVSPTFYRKSFAPRLSLPS